MCSKILEEDEDKDNVLSMFAYRPQTRLGFGNFLEMKIRSSLPDLRLWMLKHFDTEAMRFDFGNGKHIPLSTASTERLTGISCSRKAIQENRTDNRITKFQIN